MKIEFNLKPSLIDEICEATDFIKHGQAAETKEQFVSRLAKQSLKQIIARKRQQAAAKLATEALFSEPDE